MSSIRLLLKPVLMSSPVRRLHSLVSVPTCALQSKRASLGLIASCFETLCTFCLVTEEILLLTFFICLSITDKQVCWEHLLAHSQSCWHWQRHLQIFGHASQQEYKRVSGALTLKYFTYQQYFSSPQSGVFNIQSSWDTLWKRPVLLNEWVF